MWVTIISKPQPHMSSSLSSSEDSDTGVLMRTRKTAYTRRSLQRVVDPHPTTTLKRLDQAVGSPLSSDSSNGAKTPKPNGILRNATCAHNALNTTAY
ncbi:hypothetical protein Ocin01_18555 [Orchesella cincta]|uniref:Uncharacterized protein n=1 Tax=Orchesella cincta TaxID=48709 RepID=A0A1D2M575_ORCCI|nr:hypothetical protein Ocin01_18555 [Orchesella cincta]